MFAFLRSIDLAPMEWTKAVELTGKGSPYIGEILDAAFGHATAIVVLMTPDEVAYLRPQYRLSDSDPDTEPATQARPNVLFEAGMALGRDADRTILVEVGEVRPFSDVAGRHAVRLTNDVASRQALANRLKTAGCTVDLGGTDWHVTGDFAAPPPANGLPLGRRVPKSSGQLSIDFDVHYVNKGGNKIDRLQVINRGTETAYEVEVILPAEGALGFHHRDQVTIPKIPGGGKHVSLDVMNHNRMFSASSKADSFDVTITAQTEGGEKVSQDVFIDVNG